MGAALQKWGFKHVRQSEGLEFHVFPQAGTQQVPVPTWTVAAKTVDASQELQHLFKTLNPGLGFLGLKSPLCMQSVTDSDWQTSPSGI